MGEVLPSPEVCDLVDNDCNGQADDGTCPDGTLCAKSIALENPPEVWLFNGGAKYNLVGGTTPTVILNSGGVPATGNIIYKNPIAAAAFTVTFQIQPGGDGVGFFLTTSGPAVLGGSVGGFGMSGLSGYGVELDIHKDGCGGDPLAIHVGIDDLSQVCGSMNGVQKSMFTAPVNVPKLLDGDFHSMEIVFDNGTVSVAVEGTTVIPGFAIPGFPVGQPFYYGFGGSTGLVMMAPVTEVIKDVKVTFPNPQCL